MVDPAESEILPCEEILFRAALNKRYLEGGKPTADLFILREQDGGKLSTRRRKLVSLEEFKASFKLCFGVVTLHVGHVRSAGLDKALALEVIADQSFDDPLPGHASILNIPRRTADPFLAEWIASKLRDQSRLAVD